jgi:hypothetical protein
VVMMEGMTISYNKTNATLDSKSDLDSYYLDSNSLTPTNTLSSGFRANALSKLHQNRGFSFGKQVINCVGLSAS